MRLDVLRSLFTVTVFIKVHQLVLSMAVLSEDQEKLNKVVDPVMALGPDSHEDVTEAPTNLTFSSSLACNGFFLTSI